MLPLKVLGAFQILTGVALALDQIIPGWWQWKEAMMVGHHENSSFVLLLGGSLLIAYAFIKKAKKEIGKASPKG
jgi:hypothetical protein